MKKERLLEISYGRWCDTLSLLISCGIHAHACKHISHTYTHTHVRTRSACGSNQHMHYVPEEFASREREICASYMRSEMRFRDAIRNRSIIRIKCEARESTLAVINNVRQHRTVTDCSIRTLSSLDTRSLYLFDAVYSQNKLPGSIVALDNKDW